MSHGAATSNRTHLHAAWAAVAPAWGEHAEYLEVRHRATSEELLARAAVQRGDRVLELACGPGGFGLAVAELVGPDGEVVLSDVVVEMTAIAAARARAAGRANVRTRVLDLEAIDEPDASYDVVVCRDGLQFATEPAGATTEIGRVLRPGGRVAVALWGRRERNPWLGVVFDAVSAELGVPVPPPGLPGPFSLSDAGEVRALFMAAGLRDVSVTELAAPVRVGSVDAWWAMTSALAGPLATILASLPTAAADAIRARARDAAGPYQTAHGVEFPGVALIASARR
jgi:ubiquinone/menaquinone biosynthesis C-methylase UbiE